jgi:uncharacterized protein YjbJ (UPF0337 family)
MNWDQVKGQWKQMKGSARKQWGKLTDDDLDVVAGERERLAGVLQERYGITKEEAEKQIAAWNPSVSETDEQYRRKAG